MLLCSVFYGQPTGSEPRQIRAQVEAIQAKINDTSAEIARGSASASTYAKRGSLYLEMYRALYGGGYLTHFYGEKPPELQVGAIATKAIASFDDAIRLAPLAEYFGRRGQMYAARWYAAISAVNWYDEMKLMGDPEWRDMFDVRTEEKEFIMFERMMKNSDFDSAIRDLDRAIAAASDDPLNAEFNDTAARLYLQRSQTVVQNMELTAAQMGKPNRYGYSMLSDVDKAIAYLLATGTTERCESELSPVPYSWFTTPTLALRYVYFYKAELAAVPRDLNTALAAYKESAKFIDTSEKYDYFPCHFYPARSNLEVKMGLYDQAIADASYRRSIDEAPCYTGYEPRGDAYFGKGDLLKAIEDYTRVTGDNYATSDMAAVYRKRAVAYMKLGSYEKAIADLDHSNMFDAYRVETLLMRAEAYRHTGQPEKATEDERAVELALKDKAVNAIKRGVYGKLVTADGTPLDIKHAAVSLEYVGGPNEQWYPSIDEKGRFRFDHVLPRPFVLYGCYDLVLDGIPIRISGQSQVMDLPDSMNGPVIIRLDRSTQRPDID